MDRNEAILRELNLYPLWVRKKQSVLDDADLSAVVVEQQASAHSQALSVETIDNIVPGPEQVIEIQKVALAKPVSDQNIPDWPQLKHRVSECSICKLRAGCTQTVFGVGDEKADWLFVGEGPGADEDEQGEPFVGQAGKLLDNMLAAIKLKRVNNVYIANIVKCRPPNNRNPEAEEIAACLPYLRRQIELLQPKLIVALGKVASNALLGKNATLASLRGVVHDYPIAQSMIPLIVTYHPAYLLRTPSEKAKAWQDLCNAVQILQANS